MEGRPEWTAAAALMVLALAVLHAPLIRAAAAAAAEGTSTATTPSSDGASARVAHDDDEHGHPEHYAEPNYHYRYAVASRKTGDVKGAWEKRAGEDVWGAYFLRDPDGYWRTVHYEADGTGFYATVQRRPLFGPGRGKGKLEHGELGDDKGNQIEEAAPFEDEGAWQETLTAARESAVEENHPALKTGVSLRALQQPEPYQLDEAASDTAYSTTKEPLPEQGFQDRVSSASPSSFFSSYSSSKQEPPRNKFFGFGPASPRPPSYSSAYSSTTTNRPSRYLDDVRPPSYSSAYSPPAKDSDDEISAIRPPPSSYSIAAKDGDQNGPSVSRPPSYSSAYSSTVNDGLSSPQPPSYSSAYSSTLNDRPSSPQPPSYSSAFSSTASEPKGHEDISPSSYSSDNAVTRLPREQNEEEESSPSSFGSTSFSSTRQPFGGNAAGEGSPSAAAYTAPMEAFRDHDDDEDSGRQSEDERKERPMKFANYRVEEQQHHQDHQSDHDHQGHDDFHQNTNEAYRDAEKEEDSDDDDKQQDDAGEGEVEHNPDDEHESVPEQTLQGSQQQQEHESSRGHQHTQSSQALTASQQTHSYFPQTQQPTPGYLESPQQQLQQLQRAPRQPPRASSVSEQLLGPAWAEVSNHDALFEGTDWPGFGQEGSHVAQASKDVPTWVKKGRAKASKTRRPQQGTDPTSPPSKIKDGERGSSRWPTTPRSPPRAATSTPPSPSSSDQQQFRPEPTTTTSQWLFGSKVHGKEDAAYPVPVAALNPPPKRTAGNRGPVLFAAHPQFEASTPAFDRRVPPKGFVPPSGTSGFDNFHPKSSYSGWVPVTASLQDYNGIGTTPAGRGGAARRPSAATRRPPGGRGRVQSAHTVVAPDQQSRANVYWKQSWA